MAFLVGGANSAAADTGYNIANSLRVEKEDSPYLSFAVSSPNTDIFTISMWLKIVYHEASTTFFEIGKALTGEAGDYTTFTGHISWGRMDFNAYDGVANDYRVRWGAPAYYHRDDSAWYHVVMRMDSSQGTLANRARFYINGEDISSRLVKTVDPDQNDDYFNATGSSVYFPGGVSYTGANTKFDGHIAECAYIDGTSYAASTFAETDEDSGIWKPKDFKDDVTFGTNGLYLEFKQSGTNQDSSGLGADTSGNDNHMAVTNFVATDQTTDTPTNNFCTINPIDVGTNLANCTFSEGNCKVVKSGTTTSNGDQVVGSMAFSQGKWYWEIKGVSNNENLFIGVFNDVLGGIKPYHNNYFYGILGDGDGNNSQIYASQESDIRGYGIDNGTCFSDNDIIQIAFDADNYRLYVGRNGSWVDDNAVASGGTVTSGSGFNESTPTGYYQISTNAAQAGFWRPSLVVAASSANFTSEINFGNPSFSISSGNADADGYGNFEYAVPSGFYSLCTKNLAEYG